MEEQETITPEYIEIKKEYEIKIGDNKLRIEINNDEIIFILIIGLSFYKYIKKYKFNEIRKELNILENEDIEKLYEYLIKSEYKIINEDNKKKNKINDKEIELKEKMLKNEDMFKIIIDE